MINLTGLQHPDQFIQFMHKKHFCPQIKHEDPLAFCRHWTIQLTRMIDLDLKDQKIKCGKRRTFLQENM